MDRLEAKIVGLKRALEHWKRRCARAEAGYRPKLVLKKKQVTWDLPETPVWDNLPAPTANPTIRWGGLDPDGVRRQGAQAPVVEALIQETPAQQAIRIGAGIQAARAARLARELTLYGLPFPDEPSGIFDSNFTRYYNLYADVVDVNSITPSLHQIRRWRHAHGSRQAPATEPGIVGPVPGANDPAANY